MAKNNKIHPLLSLTEQIDERGLMVFDDIRRMPVYNEPYSTPYMTIALNLEGWVRTECDMRPVCFRRHDIAVLAPQHILCALESSADYRAMLIVMSVKFQEEIKRHYTNIYRDNFFYIYQHDLSLTDEQFASVLHQFQMLHTNINAHDWINSYVTIQAQTLLRYHRELTVQEIAIRLGFSEQASFSRFFKVNTGLSPTEYRERG